MNRLEDKTCIVTAAGQGIGRAIAQAFHREGAHTVAVDINEAALNAWVAEAGVRPVILDATDENAVIRLAGEVPGVTTLVNCVGFVPHGTVLDTTTEALERTFTINVSTMHIMIRHFLPGMRLRRHGSIINIASVVSSVKAAPDRYAYATTKAAVIGLTRAVARDFVGDGVRCNAISPGTVETPSLDERIAAQGPARQARADFIARQPIGRFGMPEEIAAVAVLLASDEAAFMTGENIVIDGGMSL